MLGLTPPAPRVRRSAGLLLGALLGLVFGLVTQYINRIALPGVPLYQPPAGPLGNSLLGLLAGALLGTIVAWPTSSIHGTFLASAVSAFAIVIGNLVIARPSGNTLIAITLTGILVVLPFWGLLVPLLAGLRWGANQQEEGYRDRWGPFVRVRDVLLLVLVVALAGTFALYHIDTRIVLSATHSILQAARHGELPASLRVPEAGPVSEHVSQPYSLSWEQRDIERYRIPRPGRNFDAHSVVVARFADGWNLVCLYVTPEEPPLCRGFDRLPT